MGLVSPHYFIPGNLDLEIDTLSFWAFPITYLKVKPQEISTEYDFSIITPLTSRGLGGIILQPFKISLGALPPHLQSNSQQAKIKISLQ